MHCIQSRLNTAQNRAVSELEKVEKDCRSSDKITQKLIEQIENIFLKNKSLSEELDKKREKIIKNRERISGVRADLSIWTK